MASTARAAGVRARGRATAWAGASAERGAGGSSATRRGGHRRHDRWGRAPQPNMGLSSAPCAPGVLCLEGSCLQGKVLSCRGLVQGQTPDQLHPSRTSCLLTAAETVVVVVVATYVAAHDVAAGTAAAAAAADSLDVSQAAVVADTEDGYRHQYYPSRLMSAGHQVVVALLH